ncbi:nucleosidase [Corynebacterium diphtheriae]|nr:nucleosidase [Corynebacterium diphtheriae]CAB0662137.1 nucleosidase [Corynebacterium diphtheriae]CAB0759451.1 nucleosidase [Corynebacterium diphtheriae]CAB0872725.1 nucleosidase [Corynebacterium diphtheriae]CAB0885033.1 nucleosidase [Corynebacterium diphtheriae]
MFLESYNTDSSTMAWLGLAGIGWRWWALVGVGGRATPAHPEKTALHTKSSQTAGLEAIWCEVSRKILRNTPVWWLFRL